MSLMDNIKLKMQVLHNENLISTATQLKSLNKQQMMFKNLVIPKNINQITGLSLSITKRSAVFVLTTFNN